jgi:hypothetical protein
MKEGAPACGHSHAIPPDLEAPRRQVGVQAMYKGFVVPAGIREKDTLGHYKVRLSLQQINKSAIAQGSVTPWRINRKEPTSLNTP